MHPLKLQSFAQPAAVKGHVIIIDEHYRQSSVSELRLQSQTTSAAWNYEALRGSSVSLGRLLLVI
jgi:hypothetical protein